MKGRVFQRQVLAVGVRPRCHLSACFVSSKAWLSSSSSSSSTPEAYLSAVANSGSSLTDRFTDPVESTTAKRTRKKASPLTTQPTINNISPANSAVATHNRKRNAPELNDRLVDKTQQWLDLPVGSWSRNDIAVGRSLMEDWLYTPPGDDTHRSWQDRAVWSSRILHRWMQERGAAAYNKNMAVSKTSSEMRELLNRVLYAWRMMSSSSHDTIQQTKHYATSYYHPSDTALQLLEDMNHLADETKDEQLQPGTKAYAMVFQLLSMDQEQLENPSIVSRSVELLESCLRREQQRQSPPDVMVWNSCLHLLAKCTPYQWDAVSQAEGLLGRMILDCSMSLADSFTPRPDQLTFASVLDAWAKSGRPGAGRRAHAILERMMDPSSADSIPRPNSICFNTCIDAHARSQEEGSAQAAQELLERMLQIYAEQQQQYPTTKISTKNQIMQPLGRARTDNDDTETVRPSYRSFLAALTAWGKCRTDPEAAEKAEVLLRRLQILYEETGDPGLRPRASCYAVVLGALSRRPGSGPRVESLLQQLEEQGELDEHSIDKIAYRGISPLKVCYIAAIRAWGNTSEVAEAPERADRIVQRMADQSHAGGGGGGDNHLGDLAPCAKVYSALIRAWAKSPRDDAPQRALDILRQMEQGAVGHGNQGIVPTTAVYNSVLSAFAEKGNAESALYLLDEMKGSSLLGPDNTLIQPDNISYSTCILALERCRHKPDAAELASELLNELLDQYLESGNDALRPSTFAFASAILAWGNSDHMDKGELAEQILWKMHELSESETSDVPPPDTAVCNSVLRAWTRSLEGGAPQRAELILNWMQEQDQTGQNCAVRPNRHSFNYVMQCWARSRRSRAVQHVEDHLNHMIRESDNKAGHPLAPDATSYNCLLEAIKNSKELYKSRLCQRWLRQLLAAASNTNDNHPFNLFSFRLAIMACSSSSRQGDASRAVALQVLPSILDLLTLRRSIVSPTGDIYDLILNAYSDLGGCDDEFVERVLAAREQSEHVK